MPKISIWFGIVLILTGGVSYFTAAQFNSTALIPAILGLAFVVLGMAAFKEENLKKAMHAAAFLAVLGFIGAGMRVVMTLNGNNSANTAAFISQIIMTTLCAVFIGLAVKSFYDARQNNIDN